MVRQAKHLRPVVKTSTLLIALAVVVVWFCVALSLWFTSVYNTPERVFTTMLAQNFATSGYTRFATTSRGDIEQAETAQIQFGQKNIAETHIVLRRGQSEQTAQVISTPNKDFMRYTALAGLETSNGAQPVNARAMGVWAVTDRPGELTQSFAKQTLFATYFPMGIVQPEQRAELLRFIARNTVYNPDYKTAKKVSINGRSAYTYATSVQLQTFVPMLQRFANVTGQSAAVGEVNPNDYVGVPPVKLNVSVDIMSRRIVRITYDNDKTVLETYSGYGIQNWRVTEPKKTITAQQLQELLLQ